MNAPHSPYTRLRQLAEHAGLIPIYPTAADPLPVTRSELRRYVLEVCGDLNLDDRTQEGFSETLAKNVADYVAALFVRRRKYYGQSIDLDAPAKLEALEGAKRQTTLFALGGVLAGRGLKLDEITGCLLVMNESRNMPPLSDQEVAFIARDAVERATRKAAA